MNSFFDTYKFPAILSALRTGLFPSVVLAQAALETGYGKSLLSSKYNNLFGIKADPAWTGDAVNLNTGEYINGNAIVENDAFRVYTTPKDSIKDHITFLKSYDNYAQVFIAQTPEEQAQALQDAHYATDPDYASKLIAIVNDNNLKAFDNQAKIFTIIYYLILFIAVGAIGTSLYFVYKYFKKK